MDDASEYLEPLTDRELEILRLIRDGLSNKEIAERLFLTVGTVKWYNKQTFQKLGVSSRTQAIARAQALGLIGDPEQAAPTTSLPLQTSPFIGREAELAAVQARLLDPTCRLLTLIGPGGIGKTRLALEVVGRCAKADSKAFPHSIYFVPLQPLTVSDFIVSAIAETIQFQFSSADEPKQQLLQYLREKSYLLILDNFEHLLDGAGIVNEILAIAAKIKVVVTSREALNLQEEWLYEIEGMPSPSAIEKLENYEAVQLFAYHAHRMRSAFRLTDEAEGVMRICVLAEGMPLALVLAAAWVRVLSCQEIAEAIEHNWELPPSELRNIPERHRSIQAVIDHSWRRLSSEEKAAFMKLSVFRAGFTPEAAREVGGATLGVLANLQDKSLLRRGANRHYEIHELLRRYGEAKLNDLPDELAITQTNYVTYYGKLLAGLRDDMWRVRHKQAVTQVKQEIDNIRYAWHLAVFNANWSFFQQSAEAIWHYYNDTNLFEEGLTIYQQAIQNLSPRMHNPTHAFVLALLAYSPGQFLFRLGRLTEAQGMADQSLAWLKQSEFRDSHTEMYIKGGAFQIACALSHYESAKYYAHELLVVGQQAGDEITLIAGHLFCEKVACATGDLTSSRFHLNEVAKFNLSYASSWLFAYFLNELGKLELAEQNFDAAKTYLMKSMELFNEHHDTANAAGALILLGNIHRKWEQNTEAAIYFFDALKKSNAVRAPPVIIDALIEIASLLVEVSELRIALEILERVQLHPALGHTSKIRLEAVLANIPENLKPGVASTAAMDEALQIAMMAALKMEALLGGNVP
jgi:predicted ATPase/DNA-binding CsgD family transcriptional regulator